MNEKDIRKLIQESLNDLYESRMTTNTFSLASQMMRAVDGIKILDIRSMADGTAALFRYEKDGNAYEIEIRPADNIKDKEFWGDILKKTEPHPMKDIYKILNKNSK